MMASWVVTGGGTGHGTDLKNLDYFLASFLAFFAAFFSFGDFAGFFFSALMLLCSLLMVFAPDKLIGNIEASPLQAPFDRADQ